MLIPCACGCKILIEERDNKNRQRKFISGHNSKIKNSHKPNPELKQKYICKFCFKEFIDYKCDLRIYCSHHCVGKVFGHIGGKNTQKKHHLTPPLQKENTHWNWKGGITTKSKLLRASGKYKKWRISVYKRDFFTCQECGHKSTNLHAHHIKSWKKYHSLRYDISNGKTLCKNCHSNYHPNLRLLIP